MIYQEFYAEIGRLLYAIAKADGSVNEKEVHALKTLVRKELVPLESSTDEFGTDNAYFAEMEFEFQQENSADPRAAYESFVQFVENHRSALDTRLKKAIMVVAEELARSHYGINRQELELLESLKKKIQSL